MKDVRVNKDNKSNKKWYKCIYNEELLISGMPYTIIVPGQILQITREDMPGNVPVAHIRGRDFKMAIDNTEFEAHFEEFDIEMLEFGMTEELFEKVFVCSKSKMEIYKHSIYLSIFDSWYDLAKCLVAHRLNEAGLELAPNIIYPEHVVDYIIMVNDIIDLDEEYDVYTFDKWLKQTMENNPEVFVKKYDNKHVDKSKHDEKQRYVSREILACYVYKR